MRIIFKFIIFFVLLMSVRLDVSAAKPIRMTLEDAVRIAGDSSLTAFRNRNLYASGYWEWRTFKANRLPHLSLDVTPARYYRYITQRYDSNQDQDIFRSQQNYFASAGLGITQNVDFLGGLLYMESDFEYMRNFGMTRSNQFSTVPFRIGYRQDLLGFNPLKWERKIEPVRYEKSKQEFIFNMEALAEQTVTLFFDLALAQLELKLAEQNKHSSDTLLSVGERRFRIASITETDLLTLKLDKVNADNAVDNAQINVKRAMLALTSYLGMDKDSEIDVVLPGKPSTIDISGAEAVAIAKRNNPALIERKQGVLEAKREANRMKIESMFNISLNASVGFNQVGDKFITGYRHPLQQDVVSLSVSIPLVDWGVRKGKYNVAVNNLNVAEIARKQEESSLEQDVLTTVHDFYSREKLVGSASEAVNLADRAYAQTLNRFIIGQTDINTLTLSSNRRQDANKNYIASLQNYWLCYYKIRKLTLFDFSVGQSLQTLYDRVIGSF